MDLLHQTILFGSLQAKNRAGLAPLSTGMLDGSGLPDAAFERFHELYASAGLGLVFVGGVAVEPGGRASWRSLCLDSDEKMERLTRTAESINRHGSLPVIQLMHAGRQTSLKGIPVAASAVPGLTTSLVPRRLSRRDIRATRQAFVTAAKLAARASFPMLELHAAHGYLLSDFLSPAFNERVDEYGGSLPNRLRFVSEVITDIKNSLDLQVGIRINGLEDVHRGLQAEDLPAIVRALEELGVAYISISAGVYNKPDIIMPDRTLGEAVHRHLGRIAKENSSVPIMLAGNINRIATMQDLLRREEADVLLIGRELLANPHLVVLGEAAEAATHCTMRRVCKYNSRRLPQISCPHNPWLMSTLRSAVSKYGRPAVDLIQLKNQSHSASQCEDAGETLA